VKSRIATAAIALAAAALTGTAAAGNPHGVPPGQQETGGSGAAAASIKVNAGAQAPTTAHAKTAVAASATAKTHGHASSSVKTSGHAVGSAHSSGTVQSQTSVSAGIKPSTTTGHNVIAPASSNSTKLYGNGKTSGQIATQAGFGNSNLYGPGNSQPHKVICGPHNVDVHALKAHTAACTTATTTVGGQTSIPQTSVLPTAGVAPTVSTQPSVTGTGAGQAGAGVKRAEASRAKPKSHRGVLGARAALASVKKPLSHAVLATVRKGGQLAFTGLGLWLPMVLGLGLIAAGYALRRRAGSLA
jgi:hypothetical protein